MSEQSLTKSEIEELNILEDKYSSLFEQFRESEQTVAELKRKAIHQLARYSDLETSSASRLHQLHLKNEVLKAENQQDMLQRFMLDFPQEKLSDRIIGLVQPIIKEIESGILNTFLSQDIEITTKGGRFVFCSLLDFSGISEEDYSWKSTIDWELKPALLKWADDEDEHESLGKWLRDLADEVLK